MGLWQATYLVALAVLVKVIAVPLPKEPNTSSTDKLMDPILRHGKQMHCNKRLIKQRTNSRANFCTHEKIGQLFSRDNIPWRNPCSGNRSVSEGTAAEKLVRLEPLKRHVDNMITKFDYGSCETSDNNTTSWCHQKCQYIFFKWNRRTTKLCLSLEHKLLQLFVAGLSYLDRLTGYNDLKGITENAKTVLCEIETIIDQKNCGTAPKALSRKQICIRLNLQSIANEDQTEVDVICAKANFGDYLRGLQTMLLPLRSLPKCDSSEEVHSGFSPKISSMVGSEDSIQLSRSDHPRIHKRKHNRRISAKNRIKAKD